MENMIEIFLQYASWIIPGGVMIFGLFGLVIPIFPGGVIIWLAALGYGLFSGFGETGGWVFAVITVLMFISAAADNVLMGAKARIEGASWRGIIVGLSSGIIGTIAFPPFGGLIAAPLGLYLTEYIRLGESDTAWLVTRGLLVGCGWAFVVRFGLGVVMIGLWVIWVLSNINI